MTERINRIYLSEDQGHMDLNPAKPQGLVPWHGYRQTTMRKVGKQHSHSKGHKYIYPRIILDKKYSDLIGSEYMLYETDATLTQEIISDQLKRETEHAGRVLILFFPEGEPEEETTYKGKAL